MRPSCSVTERYRTGCHDLGVTHHGCYLSATSYGNRRKEHHRRPQTLRTPHLDTHCLLPTTRSPMPNLPLALKIMRFRVPANIWCLTRPARINDPGTLGACPNFSMPCPIWAYR